jgi:transmembrane sensor
MTVTKRRPQALTNTLGWRRGVLVFDNTTLGDAAAEFNRYNRMQLVIADPAIARMPIAGKFPTTGVLRFADVVTHVFGLRVKTDREAMIVSR